MQRIHFQFIFCWQLFVDFQTHIQKEKELCFIERYFPVWSALTLFRLLYIYDRGIGNYSQIDDDIDDEEFVFIWNY